MYSCRKTLVPLDHTWGCGDPQKLKKTYFIFMSLCGEDTAQIFWRIQFMATFYAAGLRVCGILPGVIVAGSTLDIIVLARWHFLVTGVTLDNGVLVRWYLFVTRVTLDTGVLARWYFLVTLDMVIVNNNYVSMTIMQYVSYLIIYTSVNIYYHLSILYHVSSKYKSRTHPLYLCYRKIQSQA